MTTVATSTIRLGTRGSALALAQAELVAAALRAIGADIELVRIETVGDRRPPDTAWGEGAFVKSIEEALLARRVDVAVHSAKDVPTEETPGLAIAAYLPREDPADALIVRADAPYGSLAELPSGARVGTDSPRRTGFLRAIRPDLVVHPLHGNVDTRLRRLDEGETDALVLAVAGLARLGRGQRIAQRLPIEDVAPAAGQGAIAVQVRADDHASRRQVEAIDHEPTRICVEAERAFLEATGGGCRAPIGAHATLDGGRLSIFGAFVAIDGSRVARAAADGAADEGPELAARLAATLGARLPGIATSPRRPRVLVTRPAGEGEELVRRLHRAGLDPIAVPTISIESLDADGAVMAGLMAAGPGDWVVVTSANGARAVVRAIGRLGVAAVSGIKWAAVGSATSTVLANAGLVVDHRPTESTGRRLAEELPISAGDHVLLVRGTLASTDLPATLRERGADVLEIVAYRTTIAPESSREQLSAAIDEGIDAILFSSPSTVSGFIELAGRTGPGVARVPVVAIGPTTADAARSAGFEIVAESPRPDPASVARTLVAALAGAASIRTPPIPREAR